jgi:hypothetical protein
MKTLTEAKNLKKPFLSSTTIHWFARSTVTPDGEGSAPSIVHEVLHTPSPRLDAATRAFMEPRFVHDFSHVRVHTDAKAAESARAVNAQAYTVGQDIVFGAGQYAPGTRGGSQLLAHELAHVVQQDREEPNIGPAVERSEAVDEVEAGLAASAVVNSSKHRLTIGSSPLALRRSNGPRISDAESRAQQADMLCDIPGLCRLRASAPDVVTDDRIRVTARRCRPATLITGNPCLMPAFMLPPILPLPGTTPPTTAPASSSGLPDIGLERLTKHKIRIRIGELVVDLPESAELRLSAIRLAAGHTMQISAKGEITELSKLFESSAEAETLGSSVRISLSVAYDGIPHLTITATSAMDLSKRTVTAGLMFKLIGRECTFVVPRSAVEKIQEVEKEFKKYASPGVAMGETAVSPSSLASWLGMRGETTELPPSSDIGEGLHILENIDKLYQAIRDIDDAKNRCQPGPIIEVGPQVTFPFGEEALGATPTSLRRPIWGLGARIHF